MHATITYINDKAYFLVKSTGEVGDMDVVDAIEEGELEREKYCQSTPKARSKRLPQWSSPSSRSLLRNHQLKYETTKQDLGHQAIQTPASVQLHYYYLAGKQRDLSYENGLGLLNSDPLITLSMASSSVNVDEGEDFVNYSIAKKNCDNANNSLRVVARKNGIKNYDSIARIDLAKEMVRASKGKEQGAAVSRSEQGVAVKHDNLRASTKGKFKATETMEASIGKATDVGRLKREAKATMLSNAFSSTVRDIKIGEQSLSPSGKDSSFPVRDQLAYNTRHDSSNMHHIEGRSDCGVNIKTKRPFSSTSDISSLLFAHEGTTMDKQSDKQYSLAPSSSISNSLWKARPLHHHKQERNDLHRVVSLYSTPFTASIDHMYTEGSSTSDYDVNAVIRRQQVRRIRLISNASISTVVSKLSTNPSVSPSIAESEYAEGQFYTHSISSDIKVLQSHRKGAADSLRRIGEKIGAQTKERRIKDEATPQLTDTLERLIANSASYRAVARSKDRIIAFSQQMNGPSRKPSVASLRGSTAFTANNYRQDSQGLSMYQAPTNSRAHSVLQIPTTLRPSIVKATSFLNATTSICAEKMDTVTMPIRSSGNLCSALGSLRSLGIKSNAGAARGLIPTSFTSSTDQWSNSDYKTLEKTSKVEKGIEREIQSTERSFSVLDPTRTISKGNNYNYHLSSAPSSSANSVHSLHQGDLDHALAEVEERSGLRTTSKCFICNEKVVNAPISKRGEIFCGRDCRMERKRQRVAAANDSNCDLKINNAEKKEGRLDGIEV